MHWPHIHGVVLHKLVSGLVLWLFFLRCSHAQVFCSSSCQTSWPRLPSGAIVGLLCLSSLESMSRGRGYDVCSLGTLILLLWHQLLWQLHEPALPCRLLQQYGTVAFICSSIGASSVLFFMTSSCISSFSWVTHTSLFSLCRYLCEWLCVCKPSVCNFHLFVSYQWHMTQCIAACPFMWQGLWATVLCT